MRAVMRIVVVAPAVLVLASGCATKNWVRELVGQREAEIDQRVGTVGDRVGTVEGRWARRPSGSRGSRVS